MALFAGLGPLGSPTSSRAAVKAVGLTSTFSGLRPSSPVRGDMVQRVGPTCFEGRGRARPFLSQDAGPVGGVYRRVGWVKPQTSARGLESGAPGSQKVTETSQRRGSREQPWGGLWLLGSTPSCVCHTKSKKWTAGHSIAQVPHWSLGSAHTGQNPVTPQRLWKECWHWTRCPHKAIGNLQLEPNWADCVRKEKCHHSQWDLNNTRYL